MRQVTLGQIAAIQDPVVQAAIREIQRASLDYLILDVAGSAATGIAFPDGSSSVPAIHGDDATTGIFFETGAVDIVGGLGISGFVTTGGAKRVATQFDKTSSTALSDITGLSVSLAAGQSYSFEAVLFTASNAGGGVKAAIAGTATATAIIYEAVVFNAGAISVQTRATALGTAVGGVTAVTVALIKISGLITVNAAGTLTTQFAQNASNVTASSVLVGSYFNVSKLT